MRGFSGDARRCDGLGDTPGPLVRSSGADLSLVRKDERLMGMRRREGAGRSGLVHASWKSGQRGRTLLSSCQCVTIALLPPEAGRRSAHSCHPVQEHHRSLERKKGPGSQASACRAPTRQGEIGLPEVLLVTLPPQVFGADAPGSYACPVGACAVARTHSVRETGPGVLEGCLRCSESGSLAPR
jgi:hypothetical protein